MLKDSIDAISWFLRVGIPNFQRAIARVKTHWIEKFLIPLESSWDIYV